MRADEITAIVLCGGSGARLGAIDKTLVPLVGRPLVEHTITALRPQVGPIVISCGRDPAAYEGLGYQVASDERPGEGPLGGIASAVPLVATAWILIYPGDAPFPDPALTERLAPVAEEGGIAVPRADGYRQQLVMLLTRALAAELVGFYAAGGRAAKDWLDQWAIEGVEMTDVADSFFNVNTAADLAACERRLASR